MNPRHRFFWNATIVLTLWVAIIVVANLLFTKKLIIRKDFSRAQKYSLSDYSKRVVSRLEHPIRITYYLSHKLPESLKGLRRYSRDLFQEYQVYSRSAIEVRYEDPVPEEDRDKDTDLFGNGITEALVKNMASKGIPLSFKEEKGKTFYFFSSIQLSYMGRKRIVEHIRNPANLEYRLTSAMDKLISLSPAKVGLYRAGKFELSLKDKSPFSGLLYNIWKLHPIEMLDLDKKRLFSLEESFQKDLNAKKVSRKLRNEFEKWDHYLSDEAKIRSGKDKWLIADKGRLFLVEKGEGGLEVYSLPAPIPEDVKILLVFAGGRVSDEALYRIDQFLQRGGKAVFFTQVFDDQNRALDVKVDYYWSLPRHYRAQVLRSLLAQRQAKEYFLKVETNLEDFLRHYGLEMESNFLIDPGGCLKTIQESYTLGWIREVKKEEEVYFPEVIRILPRNTNRNFSFVNNLENLVFPFAHSYRQPATNRSNKKGKEKDKAKQKKEKDEAKKDDTSYKFFPLLSTTDKVKVYSFQKQAIRRENYNLTGKGDKEEVEVLEVDIFRSIPRKPPFPRALNPKRHIAAMARGHFRPFFSQAPWEKDLEPQGQQPKNSSGPSLSKDEIIVVGVGNMIFAYNTVQQVLKRVYRMEPSAYRFVVEMVEWLDSGEDLAQIRAKHVERVPLRKLTRKEQMWWTLFFSLAMPIAALLLVLTILGIREMQW